MGGSEIESTYDVTEEEKRQIIFRLKGWVHERPLFTRFFERHARNLIANAAIQDLHDPLAENYGFLHVHYQTKSEWDKIYELITATGEKQLAVDRRDSVTKEPFVTLFRREQEDGKELLIAEEVRDGEILSRAIISRDGKIARLTLNFTGSRYGDAKNPKIIDSDKYSRAVATTFNLLAGTVGQKRPSILPGLKLPVRQKG